RMNRRRHENVVLEDAVRDRPAPAAEFGRGKQLRPENVVPLLSDIQRVGANRHSRGSNAGGAGALKMAGRATTRPGRECRVTAVGAVGNVLPVAVSDQSIVRAESPFLALHEDGRSGA